MSLTATLKKMEARVAEMEKALAEEQAKVADGVTHAAGLEAQITVLEESVTRITAEMADAGAAHDAAMVLVVTDHTTAMEEIQGKLTKAADKILVIEPQLAAAEQALKNPAFADAAIAGRVAALESGDEASVSDSPESITPLWDAYNAMAMEDSKARGVFRKEHMEAMQEELKAKAAAEAAAKDQG